MFFKELALAENSVNLFTSPTSLGPSLENKSCGFGKEFDNWSDSGSTDLLGSTEHEPVVVLVDASIPFVVDFAGCFADDLFDNSVVDDFVCWSEDIALETVLHFGTFLCCSVAP